MICRGVQQWLNPLFTFYYLSYSSLIWDDKLYDLTIGVCLIKSVNENGWRCFFFFFGKYMYKN